MRVLRAGRPASQSGSPAAFRRSPSCRLGLRRQASCSRELAGLIYVDRMRLDGPLAHRTTLRQRPRLAVGAQPTCEQLSSIHHPPTVIIVMGVAGCGKSTVGSLLAARLGCPFYEGDAYHPPTNVAKMQAGTPLSDDDRWPWLTQLAGIVQRHLAEQQPAVLSCSALKPAYRHLLRTGQRCKGEGTDRQVCIGSQPRPRPRAEHRDGPSPPDGVGRIDSHDSTGVAFVLLNPPREVLDARLRHRAAEGSHFMPPSLLDSQLAALQYQDAELYLLLAGAAAAQPPEAIVEAIMRRLTMR